MDRRSPAGHGTLADRALLAHLRCMFHRASFVRRISSSRTLAEREPPLRGPHGIALYRGIVEYVTVGW